MVRRDYLRSSKILGDDLIDSDSICTGIVETAEVSGSGEGPRGWFKLEQVNVSYDHPTDAQLEHALNIDFVNEKEGPSARVAVELSPEVRKETRRRHTNYTIA